MENYGFWMHELRWMALHFHVHIWRPTFGIPNWGWESICATIEQYTFQLRRDHCMLQYPSWLCLSVAALHVRDCWAEWGIKVAKGIEAETHSIWQPPLKPIAPPIAHSSSMNHHPTLRGIAKIVDTRLDIWFTSTTNKETIEKADTSRKDTQEVMIVDNIPAQCHPRRVRINETPCNSLVAFSVSHFQGNAYRKQHDIKMLSLL